MELSSRFPLALLYKLTGVNRSSFYNWKRYLSPPSAKTLGSIASITLIRAYPLKYPSHDYRWLNAKIRLDTGLVLSDLTVHKYCKTAGIKSKAKRCCRKPGDPYRIDPNLLLSELCLDGPVQRIVSDMTVFYVKGVYYKLTLYIDLWNNEIVSHSLSSRRCDRMTYIIGSNDLLAPKKQYSDHEMILHSDQGSVYSSKDFNELLLSSLPSVSLASRFSRSCQGLRL